MKCESCKEGINGDYSTIIYGDHEKKVCDSCSFKRPGNGKCCFCRCIVKDNGNYLANKTLKIYKFFCGDMNCLSIANLSKDNLNKDNQNDNNSNSINIDFKCIICNIRNKVKIYGNDEYCQICYKNPLNRCACCNKICLDLKICSGCNKIKYCSVECQKKHRSYHKKFCFLKN